jgi:putative lipoic acid-binding regulatory protein
LNTYPYVREFKCIGSGGEEFVLSMLSAARSCCRPEEMPLLRREEVQVRPSKTGKYQAVSIFVTCDNFEQVKATYNAMKADVRLRYFI